MSTEAPRVFDSGAAFFLFFQQVQESGHSRALVESVVEVGGLITNSQALAYPCSDLARRGGGHLIRLLDHRLLRLGSGRSVGLLDLLAAVELLRLSDSLARL